MVVRRVSIVALSLSIYLLFLLRVEVLMSSNSAMISFVDLTISAYLSSIICRRVISSLCFLIKFYFLLSWIKF